MTPRHGAELPQLELDCMVVLWRQGETSAALIRQGLVARGRRLAHTTVLTVLQRLCRKQAVVARKVGRNYLFRAALGRETLRSQALARLLWNYFDSPEDLRQSLTAVLPPAAAPPLAAALALDDFDATLL